MYPIRLNLMSPDKQRTIERMLTCAFIKNTIAGILIILAIFSMFALLAQGFLQSYLADVTLQSVQAKNPARTINDRVLSINETLATANAIQQAYHPWSPHLIQIANVLPSSFVVERITLSQETHMLELVGTAPSREALLEMKTALESLDQISTVPLSLSDLTKQEQIHVSLSIPFDISYVPHT